jgi:hypothetical protein
MKTPVPEIKIMSDKPSISSFREFTRWVATRQASVKPSTERYAALHRAADVARREFLLARGEAQENESSNRLRRNPVSVLQLLAAADGEDVTVPEMETARGFRVSIVYEEGDEATGSSICVLVQCPPDLVERVQGETAYLWNGSERLELGQFDLDGKAIGTLPAGIQITLSDLSLGKVTLEEPSNE